MSGNDTAEDRARNRRVEFSIITQEEPAPAVHEEAAPLVTEEAVPEPASTVVPEEDVEDVPEDVEGEDGAANCPL